MVNGEPADSGAPGADDRRLPPVTEMAVATMILVVAGGIYVAAYIPRHAPLAVPTGLLVAAGAILIANVIALSRVREFAWDKFFLVGGWALLAYVVIAGMLEYVFVLDHTPGSQLALLTMTLVVFAVDIPLLFAFSVARYQPTSRRPL
jgi:ABC-type uncharacterized transport system permease subunit